MAIKHVTATSPKVTETAHLVDRLILGLSDETLGKIAGVLPAEHMEVLRSLRNPVLISVEIATIVDRLFDMLTSEQGMAVAKCVTPAQTLILMQLRAHAQLRQS